MSSTLLVPVPEADPVVSPWWPHWQPPRARGVPAHVSILFPFLRRKALDPEALALIAEAAVAVAPFAVRFQRTGRFEHTLFLAPEPAHPFAELARQLHARFPETPPYRGAHGHALHPHLTVLTCADEQALERAEQEVRRALPLTAHVSELWLMVENEHGGWSLQRSFPLEGDQG